MPTFYEFFAGGGLARLGLGPDWKCLFANDNDPAKVNSYRANFGSGDFVEADIASLHSPKLPGHADLAWASFPCQDLSIAGKRVGLDGSRSASVWEFLRIVQELSLEKRAPRLLVLENVPGLVSAHQGLDLQHLIAKICELGYHCYPLVMDAALFLPQSRARLFLVCVHQDVLVPKELLVAKPFSLWHPGFLVRALPYQKSWLTLPVPKQRPVRLRQVLRLKAQWEELEPDADLLRLMGPQSRMKVKAALRSHRPIYGCAVNRLCWEKNGGRSRRADWRLDGPAYCLTTRASFHLVRIHRNQVQRRYLLVQEMAKLMGVPSSYRLPSSKTQSNKLLGDGVAVPVVAYLQKHLLLPILNSQEGLETKQ